MQSAGTWKKKERLFPLLFKFVSCGSNLNYYIYLDSHLKVSLYNTSLMVENFRTHEVVTVKNVALVEVVQIQFQSHLNKKRKMNHCIYKFLVEALNVFFTN
jgi:hypothetical protein